MVRQSIMLTKMCILTNEVKDLESKNYGILQTNEVTDLPKVIVIRLSFLQMRKKPKIDYLDLV